MRALARACVRHRRITFLAWVAALIVCVMAASAAGEDFSTNFTLPESDSQQAQELLENEFPQASGDEIQVVLQAREGTLDDHPEDVTRVLRDVVAVDGIESASSPLEPNGVISEDGTIGLATAQLERPQLRRRRRDDRGPARDPRRGGRRRRRPGPGRVRRRRGSQRAAGGGRLGRDDRPARRDRRAADHVRLGRRDGPAGADRGDRARRRPQPRDAADPPDGHRRLRPAARGDDRPRRRHRLRALHRHPLPRRPPGRARARRGGDDRDGHRRPRRAVRRRDRLRRPARPVRGRHRLPLRARRRLGARGAGDDVRGADPAAGDAEQGRDPDRPPPRARARRARAARRAASGRAGASRSSAVPGPRRSSRSRS